MGDAFAAAAVVAVDDDALIAERRQLAGAALDLAHRQEPGAIDANQIVLILLSYIQEHEVVPPLPHCVERLHVDLQGEFPEVVVVGHGCGGTGSEGKCSPGGGLTVVGYRCFGAPSTLPHCWFWRRMTSAAPTELEKFATYVVRRLRDAGYEALWAGGCVRDRLLGLTPKDYDVATSATPAEVQHVFRDRRTLAIGAEFGVIAVLGPRKSRIEVATFRQDVSYSDGRHPDAVVFSTAQEDAQRRDFTINGLFFDPLAGRVIDYVGGVEDLEKRVLRAIGDPHARFDEDKLRMLRAVRFTATYDCRIDPVTLSAIQQQAGEIVIVSAERIAEEMRKMLPHPRRAVAAELLRRSGLLAVLMPESQSLAPEEIDDPDDERLTGWRRTLAVLGRLREPRFPVVVAALVREIGDCDDPQDRLVETIGGRWRLSNDEVACAAWVRRNESLIRDAHRAPWPRVQRVLIGAWAADLLVLAEAAASVEEGSLEAIEFCREKLALPREELNPPPLLTGDDLIRAGLRPGPHFRELLDNTRDAQLEGKLHTREQALAYAQTQSPSHDKG